MDISAIESYISIAKKLIETLESHPDILIAQELSRILCEASKKADEILKNNKTLDPQTQQRLNVIRSKLALYCDGISNPSILLEKDMINATKADIESAEGILKALKKLSQSKTKKSRLFI